MDERMDLWKKIMRLYYLPVFFFLRHVLAVGLSLSTNKVEEIAHDDREQEWSSCWVDEK